MHGKSFENILMYMINKFSFLFTAFWGISLGSMIKQVHCVYYKEFQ